MSTEARQRNNGERTIWHRYSVAVDPPHECYWLEDYPLEEPARRSGESEQNTNNEKPIN